MNILIIENIFSTQQKHISEIKLKKRNVKKKVYFCSRKKSEIIIIKRR